MQLWPNPVMTSSIPLREIQKMVPKRVSSRTKVFINTSVVAVALHGNTRLKPATYDLWLAV